MHQQFAPSFNSIVSRRGKLLAAIVAVPLISGLGSSDARAADAYWDTNGATAGAGGAAPTGTWGTDLFWSTDADGLSATGGWTADDVAVFSAGLDATGEFTVNVNGTQSAGGLTFEEGALTLAGGEIALTGAATINVTSTSAIIDSIISGSAGLIKSGSGMLTLRGANTYTGGTTINGGVISFNGDGTSGARPLGTAPASFEADNIILDGGTLRNTSNAAGAAFVASNRGIQLGPDGGTVDVSNAAGRLVYNGTIGLTPGTAAATLTKTGPGEFRARQGWTFTKLIVDQGLYRINGSGGGETGFGAVPLVEDLSAITIRNGATIGQSTGSLMTLATNRGITLGSGGGGFDTANGALAIPGKISGTGGIHKLTSGELTLSGDNSYAGGTTFNNGTINFNHDNAAGIGDISITSTGAVSLRYSGAEPAVTLGNNVIINAGAGVDISTGGSRTLQLNGVISGAGNWTRGASVPAGTVVLAGASPNTFSGNLTISSGALVAAKDAALGTAAGNTTVQPGGSLVFEGDIAYTTPEPLRISGLGLFGGITGAIANRSGNNSFAGTVELLADSAINAASDSSLALNGIVSGASDLIKTGGGTLALNTGNTYAGDTTVLAGTLAVTSAASLGTSTNAIQIHGGTLQTAAPVNFTRNATVNATGGTFDTNGFDSTIGSITGAGGFTKSGAGKLTANQVKVDGPLAISTGALEVAPNGAATGTVETTALSIPAGGALRLNDNDLIVDYADGATSPEVAIRDLVKAGRVDQSTNGIFSTPGATRDNVLLAVVDNSDWGQTTYNGIPVDTSTVIGKYTYFGDANLDGKVTGDDYVAVDSNLGTGDSWIEGDFNMDGRVSGDDYVAIDSNLGSGTPDPLAFAELKAEMVALHVDMFGEGYLTALAAFEAEMSAVPEPGAISVVGLGILGYLSRRQSKVVGRGVAK